MFSAKTLDTMDAYSTWDSLRDRYLGITEAASEANSPDALWDLYLLLIISHYYATTCATEPHKQSAEISTKVLIYLLTRVNVVLADKAPYKTGSAA